MAIGKASDFKVYPDQFWSGVTEVLMQNTDAFNGASNNTIRLTAQRKKGNFDYSSFVPEIASLISRRDITSTSAATDLSLIQSDTIGVKCNRKIGPVADTVDAFRKIAEDPAVFSLLVGQQSGKGILVDYLDSALASLAAALSQVSGLVFDGSAATIDHSVLASGLSKFGDNSKNIVAWVMHSKPYFDLVQASISDKITNVADLTIMSGTAATLGRPTVVVDSSSLIISGTPDNYVTLGLVAGAAEVSESEDREVASDLITGLENLVMRIQGEFAYNLRLKGFKWDVSNGGVNPTLAALATDSNWDQAATEEKQLPGVYIYTK